MSIVWVRQHWENRSGNAAGIGSSSVTRHFVARTDNRFDNETDILSSGLVPVAFQSTLPENSFFLCRSVNATQRDDEPFFWDVGVEYSDAPLTEEEREREENPNPLARPPKVSWGAEQYQKAVYKDRDDNAILNSANDPFDPVPEIDDARWIVNVQQNVSGVPVFVLDLNNAINSGPITVDGVTFPERTVKVQSIRIGEEQTENGVLFRSFEYQLNYRRETWVFSILDAGFQANVIRAGTDGDEKAKITLQDGSEPSSPQPLDGNGSLLLDPTPETAVFLDFDVYEEADLTVLPGVT